MSIVTLRNHPEALALAGIELATQKIDRAATIVEKIGTGDSRNQYTEDTRRRVAARDLRIAAQRLLSAAACVEAGL